MQHTRWVSYSLGVFFSGQGRMHYRGLAGFSIRASRLKRRVLSFLCALLLVTTAAPGAVSNNVDLTEIPIEQLMNIPVTILKGQGTLSRSPAAISVVTQEDIRRSGAMSIPEALRQVPGLQVARVDASEWAISSRGFNSMFADKLLVLQDGRSLYTPLFSGVFWDVRGTMLEDIERIEVIRGPGATLWGANAVNGVINILTKDAKDTQGTLLTGGGGTANRGFAALRHGFKLADNASLRVYGTYRNHDDSVLPSGREAHDGSQMGRVGFRMDMDVSDQDLLTVQGDVYMGEVNQVFSTFDPSSPGTDYTNTVADTMEVRGGNLLGRWSHSFSESSGLKLQFYYDRTERDTAIFTEQHDTFDLDFQHSFAWGNYNDFIWGAGYRITADELGGSPTITFNPSRRTLHLFNAFLQDEIKLVPNRFHVMLGTKIEHNDFTGLEIQPGARLLWTPDERHTVWASVSRAVRTPSRTDHDVKFNQILPPNALFPGSPVGATTIYGNHDLDSVELIAYELGYRVQPHKTVSFDAAAFVNVYDKLRSIESGFASNQQPPSAPPPPPGFIIPMHVGQKLYGETYGVEAAISWEVTRRWRLQPAYTFIDMQLHTRASSTDTTGEDDEGRTPHHQFSLRSSLDLPRNVSLDCMVRYVDRLSAYNIPAYVTMDVRVAWRPTKQLELAIVGQDLIEAQHPEFGPAFVSNQQTEVPRTVYGKITWNF